MQVQMPENIPPYAKICLETLSTNKLGEKISLGGAFGLMHYFEYRSTFDVDAWWDEQTTSAEKKQVVTVLETALHPFGSVKTRRWGDVVSIELKADNQKAFSFQIANRSVQLEPSVTSPWGNIPLDSFTDLIASKMVALVDRGMPRDFLDIYTVCKAELVTIEACWQLWQRRQVLTHGGADEELARLAIQGHLARIEQHRPLLSISDQTAQTAAKRVRSWYKTEFIHEP